MNDVVKLTVEFYDGIVYAIHGGGYECRTSSQYLTLGVMVKYYVR